MNKLNQRLLNCLRNGFLITIIIVSLCSCINIESKVSFLDDGSGSIRVKYILPIFGEMKSKEHPLVLSLGLGEDNYHRLLEESENLRLIEYVKKQRETNTEIIVSIGFTQIEELSEIEMFSPLKMKLISSGDKKIFSQLLYDNTNIITIEKNNNLYENIMDEATITFVIETPGNIKSANTGVIAGNQQRVEVVLPLSTFLFSSEYSYLSVDW